MQSATSGAAGGSDPVSGVDNTISLEMEEPPPLQRLVEGEELFVKIDPKSIFIWTMESLGAMTAPQFSTAVLDDESFKVSIKLDVSDLSTVSGDRISFTVVYDEPSFNESLALDNAVMAAFKRLKENHLVSIVDFSSRLAQRYDAYNMNELVAEGITSLQLMFSHWDNALGYCESFAVKLQGMQFCNMPTAHLNDKGKVYATVADLFTDVMCWSAAKSANIRSELKDVEFLFGELEKKRIEKAQTLMSMAPLHRVFMPNKDILGYVLSFLGIGEPEYVSKVDSHCMSITTVLMNFPFMEKYQFSGPLQQFGNGGTALESSEDAAFKALLFIEKYMPLNVVDFNYSLRKKSLKNLKKLIELLSNVLELAYNFRLMWAKLNNAIELQVGNFSLDAPSLFTGEFSDGQIEAYRFCYSGFVEVHKTSLTALDSCGQHILALQKLTWKLVDVQSNIAM